MWMATHSVSIEPAAEAGCNIDVAALTGYVTPGNMYEEVGGGTGGHWGFVEALTLACEPFPPEPHRQS